MRSSPSWSSSASCSFLSSSTLALLKSPPQPIAARAPQAAGTAHLSASNSHASAQQRRMSGRIPRSTGSWWSVPNRVSGAQRTFGAIARKRLCGAPCISAAATAALQHSMSGRIFRSWWWRWWRWRWWRWRWRWLRYTRPLVSLHEGGRGGGGGGGGRGVH